MPADTIEELITNAIHTAFVKYPEGDGGPHLDYEWIAPEQSSHITKAILLELAAAGFQVVKKGTWGVERGGVQLQNRDSDAANLVDAEDWSAAKDDIAVSVAAVRGDNDVRFRRTGSLGCHSSWEEVTLTGLYFPSEIDVTVWPGLVAAIGLKPTVADIVAALAGGDAIRIAQRLWETT